MDYKVIRLAFDGGVHLGNGQLSDASPVLMADTLFSALCLEAISLMGDSEKLVEMVSSGKIRISDAFPYIQNTLYLPKPFVSIKKEDEGDSKKKKAFKKLKYIPIDKMDTFLAGDMDAENEVDILKDLGKYELRTNVVLARDGESTPYHVGVYHFNEGNGLYCLLATQTEEDFAYVMDLLDSLGYTGIGGRRSTGLGRFRVSVADCPESLQKRLDTEEYATYSSLAFSLPKEDELAAVLEKGNCQFIMRSGFVASDDYADEFRKKKDLYGIAAGSITRKRYEGDLYDVSEGGRHPVYRYGFPMFIGVE